MNHPKPTIVELLAELGIPRNDATMQPILDRIEAAYEEANGENEQATTDCDAWRPDEVRGRWRCVKDGGHDGEHEDATGLRWAP